MIFEVSRKGAKTIEECDMGCASPGWGREFAGEMAEVENYIVRGFMLLNHS